MNKYNRQVIIYFIFVKVKEEMTEFNKRKALIHVCSVCFLDCSWLINWLIRLLKRMVFVVSSIQQYIYEDTNK